MGILILDRKAMIMLYCKTIIITNGIIIIIVVRKTIVMRERKRVTILDGRETTIK